MTPHPRDPHLDPPSRRRVWRMRDLSHAQRAALALRTQPPRLAAEPVEPAPAPERRRRKEDPPYRTLRCRLLHLLRMLAETGTPLPSSREMAVMCECQPNSIPHAIDELEEEGWISVVCTKRRRCYDWVITLDDGRVVRSASG